MYRDREGADLTAFDWPADAVRPYFGLGLGYLVVDTLFEAMEHERLLDKEGFWADVQAAISGVLRTSDVIPLYVRLGDWVGTLVVILTLGGAGLLLKRRFGP